MLNFQNEPPIDPRGHGLTIKRTPVGRPLVAIVTSEDLVGCNTHFHKGRTHPCQDQDCGPCAEGVPWRWHSYLAAYAPSAKVHFLFESTARATEPFVQYRTAHGTLRGCLFTARRITASPNSKVILETKPADLGTITLPTPPDLLKVLSILWSIPLPEIQIAGHTRNADTVQHQPPGKVEASRIINRLTPYIEPEKRKPA